MRHFQAHLNLKHPNFQRDRIPTATSEPISQLTAASMDAQKLLVFIAAKHPIYL